MSKLHKATKRDYLARVNEPEFPKHKAAVLAKKWGFDYWDGDRRVNYGGYKYIPGRWRPLAEQLLGHYKIKEGANVLDIGCGKGFLLFEMKLLRPDLNLFGLDISDYAITNAKPEIKDNIVKGCASNLPFTEGFFDLTISLNTLHNLHNNQLFSALNEINRVSKGSYICVESYRSELEKENLLYWQVTCEQFNTPEDWEWWFSLCKYKGDYSYIFFE